MELLYQNVGHDFVVVHGKVLAGTSEARLHLVCDEQHVVLRAAISHRKGVVCC